MHPGDDSSNAAPAAARTVAVLALHKIGAPPAGGWSTWNYVAEETFAGHLGLLLDRGFNVLDLDTFLRGMAEPQSLPGRAALLTFDDGHASMLSVAAPILSRFGLPSVLFVPTGFIGDSNRFDQGNEPDERICTWQELRELDRRGVAIQSHGVEHRSFSELTVAQQAREAELSRRVLEEGIGREVTTIAYPYGDAGQDPASTARVLELAGYRAAFVYKGGPQRLPAEHPYRLTRIAVGPDTNLSRHLESIQ